MKKTSLSFLLGIIAALLWPAPWPTQAQEPERVPRFEPGDCASPIPADLTIHCGHLVVAEVRSLPADSPDRHTIRLAVALLKSPDPHSAPDPLVFLNGGPGSHALLDLPRFIGIFRLLLSDLNRDVILFDQRGVGLSQPALECPELVPSLLAQAQGQTLTPAEEHAPYRACRDRWLRVDTVFYDLLDHPAKWLTPV